MHILRVTYFIHFLWYCLREFVKIIKKFQSCWSVSFILISSITDQAVLLSGENGYWSLSRLKWLWGYELVQTVPVSIFNIKSKYFNYGPGFTYIVEGNQYPIIYDADRENEASTNKIRWL